MKKKTKKLCALGLFTATALGIFVLENAIPSVPMFPYMKIGLANVVTLFILFLGGSWSFADCLAVLLGRVLLGAVCTGQLTTVMFSLAGGLLALLAMYAGKKLFFGKAIPVVSIMGALAHNIGQTAVAVAVYGSFSVFSYLPFLLIGGIISGAVTGFAVMLLFKSRAGFIARIRDLK